MLANTTHTPAAIPPGKRPHPPRSVISGDIECLTDIFLEDVNLAVWERPADPGLSEFARVFAEQAGSLQRFISIRPDEPAADILPGWAKALPGADQWLNDIQEVIEMFCCLFEPTAIGVRLHVLNGTMCPRFHVDRVAARLLVTYSGKGTEWLAEDSVSRSPDNGGLPEQTVSASDIRGIAVNAVAILKGELWEGNEGQGLIHRSPDPQGMPRLVLALDWLS